MGSYYWLCCLCFICFHLLNAHSNAFSTTNTSCCLLLMLNLLGWRNTQKIRNECLGVSMFMEKIDWLKCAREYGSIVQCLRIMDETEKGRYRKFMIQDTFRFCLTLTLLLIAPPESYKSGAVHSCTWVNIWYVFSQILSQYWKVRLVHVVTRLFFCYTEAL